MAIICIRTGAETNSLPKGPQPLVGTNLMCSPEEDLPSRASDEEVLRMGDYRDILSLTRVLVYGPKSKADVDIVIERYFIYEKDHVELLSLWYFLLV